MTVIGTLRETSLHASLKAWFTQPGDLTECLVDGYVVDLLRGETVIEIQTGHFSAIAPKLRALLPSRPVCLVHPIARERWLVQMGVEGARPLSRRKSPRRGCAAEVFGQLVSFPELLRHPNFSLEVLLTREEVWRSRAAGRRRRQRVVDRHLLAVVDRLTLAGPADCLALLPAELPRPFTNRELAGALRQPAALAAQMTYCLRRMGVLCSPGKRGHAVLHDLTEEWRR